MRGKKRVRDENVHNSEINNGKEIGQRSNVLMTNGGYRETHPCILSTALLHNGHGRVNSNDIYKEYK